MKKLAKIFFFILIVAVSLTSCVNDKDDNGKNFIKIIESTENGVSENSVFSYYENQIISADNSKEKIEYTYNAGLITKMVTFNKLTEQNTTIVYTYLKEKLVKVTSSEDYVIYYTHNTDGTVSYEKYNGDSQNQELKVYHGTLYFKNKNLIKDERVFDDVAENVSSTSKTTFEYDTYNNPYFSILGYDKLLNFGALISKNNAAITVLETAVVNGGETITSANLYKTTFKYDADNYPTEQVSESTITNPNYSKIQYLY